MKTLSLSKSLTGLLILLLSPLFVQAQQTDTVIRVPSGIALANKVIGYYRYFPQSYKTSQEKYPLILFLHGRGEAQTINNGGVVTTQPITALLKSGTPPRMLHDQNRDCDQPKRREAHSNSR